MPSSPRDLLVLAKTLQLSRSNEASLRAAISRAYYAALHETESTFAPRSRIGAESSHAEIIGRAVAYGNGPNPGRTDANNIAMLLPKLRRTRNKADYELVKTVLPEESEYVIGRAELIVQWCESIRTKQAGAAAP